VQYLNAKLYLRKGLVSVCVSCCSPMFGKRDKCLDPRGGRYDRAFFLLLKRSGRPDSIP
jgi:hypothetical protein